MWRFLCLLCSISCKSPESKDVPVDSAPQTLADAVPDVEGPKVDSAAQLPLWILSMENKGEKREVHRLVRISVEEETFGDATTVCADVSLPSGVPLENNIISSLTFNNGRLYASGRVAEHGDAMFEIHPCNCVATLVGGYNFIYVAGITSNGKQDMFGVSGREDAIITIEPTTALGKLFHKLNKDWGTVGLTWTGPATDSLWVISGKTDELVLFSAKDGSEKRTIDLDFDFTSVGVEYHPSTGKIYACSSSGELLTVDPSNGHVDVGPFMGIEKCNNLAAPFGSTSCIE